LEPPNFANTPLCLVLFKLILFMLTSSIICESHESATVGFAGGCFRYCAQKTATLELEQLPQRNDNDRHKQKERAADFSTALNCCTEATIRSHWEGHFASLSHG